jgi:DNA-binding FrmR family transcriptional regulator
MVLVIEMKEEVISKQTRRSTDEKSLVINHISRIEGQITGIKKMIEDDRYCGDILIQLSAVDKSIKSIANHIIDNHLHSCVINDIKNGNEEVIDEVVSLFKRFQ